jgi:hypothetical protein
MAAASSNATAAPISETVSSEVTLKSSALEQARQPYRPTCADHASDGRRQQSAPEHRRHHSLG